MSYLFKGSKQKYVKLWCHMKNNKPVIGKKWQVRGNINNNNLRREICKNIVYWSLSRVWPVPLMAFTQAAVHGFVMIAALLWYQDHSTNVFVRLNVFKFSSISHNQLIYRQSWRPLSKDGWYVEVTFLLSFQF